MSRDNPIADIWTAYEARVQWAENKFDEDIDRMCEDCNEHQDERRAYGEVVHAREVRARRIDRATRVRDGRLA